MFRGTTFFLIGNFALLTLSATAQSFVNGSLNGTIGTSNIPTGWQQIAFNEPISQATISSYATSDVTGLTGPVPGNINGNPFHNTTFVSGLHMDSGSDVFHEGLKQTVNSLVPGNAYEISFYQIVVKQSNATDNSGQWGVYSDNTLLGMSAVTVDNQPVASNSHVWERRTITFTATAASHLFQFLPFDDDSNILTPFGVRMGIDSILIKPAVILPSNVDFALGLGSNGEDVQLNWQDVHALGFSIERSPDGRLFESAGTVEANAQQAYSFTDATPFVESHYRIGALQMDGNVVYSAVKSISTQSPVTAFLSRRTLHIEGGYCTQYEVMLLDLQGKQVFSDMVEHQADLGSLADGAYFLRVVSPGKEPIMLEKKILLSD